jgi:16S rRNA processing protein RimM
MIYKNKKIVNIGTIVKLHGVQGGMILRLSAGYSVSIIEKASWCFISFRNKPVPYKIDEVIEMGPSEIILHIENISTKEGAEQFLNKELGVEQTIPTRKKKTDNILLLNGYKVYDHKKLIGTIQKIENTGKQFLFVLEKELLIPAHDDLIESIDDKKKSVFMKLPDGLV